MGKIALLSMRLPIQIHKLQYQFSFDYRYDSVQTSSPLLVPNFLSSLSTPSPPSRLSWLEGVGCGLSYLHELSPPIIHRDLTATNVLLTSYLVAKVSDVGNSKILELEPDQHARTMTKQPGTPIYMAPEAMSERHRYGTPLDIFSFGCLALFTLIQVGGAAEL